MDKFRILIIDNTDYKETISNVISDSEFNCTTFFATDCTSAIKIINKESPSIVFKSADIEDCDINKLVQKVTNINSVNLIQFLIYSKSAKKLKTISDHIDIGTVDYFLTSADNTELAIRLSAVIKRYAKQGKIHIYKDNLASEKEFYEQLVESANESIYIVGQSGIPEYVNSNCTNLTGYTKDELLRIPIIELVYPDDREFVMKKIAGRISGDTNAYTYHVRLIHKSGQIKWVTQSSVGIKWKGKVGALLFAADITHLKLAELKLQESQEKYRTVVENANDAIFILQDGYVVFNNQAVHDITGYTPEDFAKEYFVNFLHPDDKEVVLAKHKKRLAGEVIPRYHLRIKKKNGDYVVVEINATQFIFNGKPATLNFTTDITDRLKVEKQLELQNKELQKLNNTKNKLFSIIAHDLRSPFGSLISFIDVIKSKVVENDIEDLPHLLDYMSQAANNGFNLLENLLEWSRLQTDNIEFKPEKINIKDTVDIIVSLYSDKAINKNIELYSEIREDTYIFADENMLSTVIRNLVNNAIKFTPLSGSIAISYSKNGSTYSISVTDTGVGIKSENIDKLFAIDENISTNGTEKEKGTGLGLVICNEFAKNHKGKLSVESSVNKGSKFTITLPVNPET